MQIYSRNSENNTGKYPDIVAMFPGVLAEGTKSIVLDAEAVAYDPESNKILPFQVGRENDVRMLSLDACGAVIFKGIYLCM